MKFIIVKLGGGLGNQLFQYATGRMLAKKCKGVLLLDYSSYASDSYGRNCAIKNFNVKGHFFEKGVLKKLLIPGNRIYAIGERLRLIDWKLEKSFTIHNEIFSTKSFFSFLHGYWQSEEYFKTIRNCLLEELTLCKHVKHIKELIPGTKKLVSIHIRNQHGVQKDKSLPVDNRYGRLGIEYYKNAIKKINALVDSAAYVIFSDDPNWCKEQFSNTGEQFYFVDDFGIREDYEQLMLMSMCDHQIISNSTFSWWGAWLCDSEKNIVIRPEKPFIDPSLLYEQHFPERWISCSSN